MKVNVKVNSKGGITIPVAVRRMLHVNAGDHYTLSVKDHSILLEPHTMKCIGCGSSKDRVKWNGLYFCKSCLNKIKKL